MTAIRQPPMAGPAAKTRHRPAGARENYDDNTAGSSTHTSTAAPVGTGHACEHRPPCPPADAPDHDAARLIAYHPEQGWGLLCNGVIVFDDTGELLPDGRSIPTQKRIPEPAPA